MIEAPFVVRPFNDAIAPTSGTLAHHVAACIVGSEFRITLLGRDFAIPAREVGSDRYGEFALIDASETEVTEGWWLTVSAEHEWDEVAGEATRGCEIKLAQPGDIEPLRDALRRQGVDPDTVNIAVPDRSHISVSFGPRGQKDGYGYGGPSTLPATTIEA